MQNWEYLEVLVHHGYTGRFSKEVTWSDSMGRTGQLPNDDSSASICNELGAEG